MNLNQSHSTSSNVDDDVRNECLMYLLGELTPERRTAFEAKLIEPEISDELLRQSQSLTLLGQCQVTPAEMHASSTTLAHSHSSIRWSIAATAIAIAAMLLAVVTLGFNTNDNSETTPTAQTDIPMDDLLIAQAWVEQTPAPLADSYLGEIPEQTSDWLDDQTEPMVMESFENEFDETFSWMVVAVAAGDDIDG